MKETKFNFSIPTGIVGLVLLILSFVAYAVGIILSFQGIAASNAGNYWAAADWNIAAMWTFGGASVGLVIGLLFLYLNLQKTKKINMSLSQLVSKMEPMHSSSPHCEKCNKPLRYRVTVSSWPCDSC